MIKLISALAVGAMIGCSSKGTKDVPPAPNAQAPTTTATIEAKTADKPTLAQEKSERHGKNKKSSKSLATKIKTEKAIDAGKAVAAGKSDVTCKSGTEERKLAIKASGEGCNLEYTKAGQSSSIASQVSGTQKCDDVSKKIQDKLVAAGYACE